MTKEAKAEAVIDAAMKLGLTAAAGIARGVADKMEKNGDSHGAAVLRVFAEQLEDVSQ